LNTNADWASLDAYTKSVVGLDQFTLDILRPGGAVEHRASKLADVLIVAAMEYIDLPVNRFYRDHDSQSLLQDHRRA
jgi:hypothetical protein